MSGIEMKYFVLKPKSKKPGDPYAAAARFAMVNYALAIEDVNPQLAEDLRKWVYTESEGM